jgi:hypothetical protein
VLYTSELYVVSPHVHYRLEYSSTTSSLHILSVLLSVLTPLNNAYAHSMILRYGQCTHALLSCCKLSALLNVK